MDLYLADKKTLMVIISGSMHVALFIATNVGAQLYNLHSRGMDADWIPNRCF